MKHDQNHNENDAISGTLNY